MKKTNSLFIGGPLNGRKDINTDYEIYRVYENNLHNGALIDNHLSDHEPIRIKEHLYIRYDVAGTLIYIHNKLTFNDAISKLVSCYRGGKRKKKY